MSAWRSVAESARGLPLDDLLQRYVNRAKHEIKNAPEFDDFVGYDAAYHVQVGA